MSRRKQRKGAGGIDLRRMTPEQGRKLLEVFDTTIANARPVTDSDLRDIAEAKLRWDAGERGEGIAARIADWGNE